jgi:hypothetical protein
MSLGSIIGGILGYKGQKDANKRNIALSREQMAFQERMSNTAYQRSMQDMKLAGLNPILSAKQPASTPGGSSTRVESAIGAGVQAFNNTNSALAGAANQRANATLTSAKGAKEQFMVDQIFNKNLDPKQKQINAALAAYGLTPAITQMLTNQVTKQDFKSFERTIEKVGSEMSVMMNKSHSRELFDALSKMGGFIQAWSKSQKPWTPEDVK